MNKLRMGAAVAVAIVASTPLIAYADVTPLTGTGWQRLAGDNRYETAVEISKATFTAPIEVAFVASGESFADALAAGPIAGGLGGPVLLVKQGDVPDVVVDELARLAPEVTVVLGGPSVVSDAAMAEVEAATGKEVGRLYGTDRYETAAEVLASFGAEATSLYLASGEDFADALAGGPAAAREGANLTLTKKGSLPDATRSIIEATLPTEVVILGGLGAVSQAVEDQVKAAAPGVTITRFAGADRYGTAKDIALSVWPEGAGTAFYAPGGSFPDALAGTPSAVVNDAPILLTRSTCHPYETASAADDLGVTLRVALGGEAVTYGGSTVCGPAPVYGSFPSDLDCRDFASQAAAQTWFNYWYPRVGDIFNLDGDDDLKVCEVWP